MNDRDEREPMHAHEDNIVDAQWRAIADAQQRKMTDALEQAAASVSNQHSAEPMTLPASEVRGSGSLALNGCDRGWRADLPRGSDGGSWFGTGISRALLCLAVLVALFVPRADRAQSPPQSIQIIAGASSGGACHGSLGVPSDGVLCNFGYSGDGGPATGALLNYPMAAAADQQGNVYIVDAGNSVVRKIDTSGNISTYAWVDASGNITTSGPPASLGSFPSGDYPSTVAVDGQGNVKIGLVFGGQGAADDIAMATDSQGNVYDLKEQEGASYTIYENGSPLFCSTNASCKYPVFPFDTLITGLGVDGAGNIYTIEAGPKIVELNPATGSVTTVVTVPSALLGATPTESVPAQPLAADSQGNLYVLTNFVLDGAATVSEYNVSTQTWSTIAGTGVDGFSNSPPVDAPSVATQTELNNATGISIGPDGALYIADTGNNVVRRIGGGHAAGGCDECGPTSLAITDQISRSLPSSWAFDPTLHKLYMITSSTPGVVTAFDTTNDTVIDNIPLPATSSINTIAVDSTNNLIYVPDTANNAVYVISATTDQQVAGSPVSLPGSPGSIAIVPANSRAYITIADGGYSYPSPSLPAVAVIAAPSISNPSASYVAGIGAYDGGTSLAGTGPIIADPQRDKVYVRFLGTIGSESAYSFAQIDASSTGNNAVSTYVLSVTSTFSGSIYSDSMAIDESTGNVMIGDGYDPDLHLFEYSTQTLSGFFGEYGGFYNYHVAADSVNGIFYTWDGYGNVGYIIPNQTSGIISSTSVFGNSGLTSVAVDSSTEQAYIANCNTTNSDGTLGTLTLWDGLKESAITTLPLEIPSTATSETCGSMFVDASSSNPAAHSAWLGYTYGQFPSGFGGGIDVINGPTPAARPAISISPSTLSFGTAGVGQGSFVTNVTVQNNGTAPLTGITPIFQETQDPGSIQINNTFSGPSTCGAPVAPGGSCVIFLQFTPSQVESFSGSILFLDNSPDTPQSVSVTGTGVPATGPLTISPQAFPPGVVNQPYYQQVLVSGLVGAPSFNVSGSLPPGLSLIGATLTGTPTQASTYNFTITATDTATGKTGSQFYSLTITAGAVEQTTVDVYGNGSSGTVSFGSVEQNEPSATQQVNLTDDYSSSSSMQIYSITLTGPNATDFAVTNTCGIQTQQLFSAGQSCGITATFTPTAPAGTSELAEIVVGVNAQLAPIFLTGTSAAPLGAPASLPVAVSVDNGNPPNLAATPNSGGCYPPECGGSGNSSLGAISSGGKFVGFSFAATNLPGPPPASSFSQPEGAYVRNTCVGATSGCEESTQYISYGPTSGPAANNGAACNTSSGSASANVTGIDSTGQYVLFESNACAFSGATSQNANQIFLRDVINGNTTLISIDPTNSIVLSNGANSSSMSEDGRFFAFDSTSTNADPNFTNPNGGPEVYWRGCTTQPSTTCAPSTVVVSQDNVSDAANDASSQPSISASGRFVAFASTATQLTELAAALQNNVAGTKNVFLWDSCSGTAANACTPHTILISQNANGNAVGGTNPSVSADGRFVTFLSSATTLLPTADQAQYGGTQEAYLVDTCLSNGTQVSGCASQPPILVSQLNGVPGDEQSLDPFISADGSLVLFSSRSDTLMSQTLFNQSPVYKYRNCLSPAAPANCAASLQIISVDANGNPIQNVNSSGSLDPTGQYFIFGVQSSGGYTESTEIYLEPTLAPLGQLTITTLGLPNTIVGARYSQTVSATGAGTPATFAVTVGSLPPGLTLLGSGSLAGTPITPGIFSFTITALGTAGQTAQQAYQVTVYPPLSVAPTSLPSGLVGSAYSQTLTATGGTGTGYEWSVSSGSALSAVGLTLSPAGLISGSPTTTESVASVTVQVTDSGGFTAQQAYQLTVTTAAPTLVSIAVTPASPVLAVAGTQQFTATGTYSDSSTQDLTNSVVWSSSNTSVATISSPGGLATAVAPGSTTISATLGSVAGSTTLAVGLSVSEPISVTDSVSVVPLTLVAPIQVAAPVAYFTQGSPLGFNSTSQSQQVVGIENIGAAGSSLTLSSVAISTGASFSVSPASCFNGATTGAIPPGDFCTVTVTYTGSSPTTDTGTLIFTDNAGLSNLNTSGTSPNFTQSITLNGAGGATTAPAAPSATVSVPSNGNPLSEPITVTDSVSVVPLTLVAPIQVAAPVVYFTQGSPLGFNSTSQSQQVVGIENIGASGSSLNVSSVALSTGAPFNLSGVTCFNGATETAIPSGGFCTVTVTYTGSSPTTDTGTLTFADNAGLSNLNTSGTSPNFTQSITLNGAGGVTTVPAAPSATVPVPSNGSPLSEPISVTDSVSVAVGPIVIGVSPNSGPAAGGTSVTITGAGFTGATAVNFGSAAAASFTVNSDTQITATSPAGTSTVNVNVTTPIAISPIPSADQFTYTSSTPPIVTESAPDVTGSSTATFSGTVNPENLATSANFQYGLDPKYSGGGPLVYTQATPSQSVGSDLAVHAVTASVSGLIPNSVYHVRLVVGNSAGTTNGPDETFTTLAGTAPSTPKIGGLVKITFGSGSYSATITLTNNGTYPLSELTLLKATLGSAGVLTFPSGTTLTNLAPGASATLVATFSTSAGASGQSVPLMLSGTYTAGSLSGSWTLGFRSLSLP